MLSVKKKNIRLVYNHNTVVIMTLNEVLKSLVLLVVNSDLIIESLVDEMDKFSVLFEISLQLKTKNYVIFL